MELFRITPVTAVFLAFFVSSCIFGYCGPEVKCILALLAAIGFLIIKIGRAYIFPEKSDFFRRTLAGALCACAVAGIYSLVMVDLFYSSFDKYSGVTDYVEVRIENCDYSLPYVSRYTAVITSSEVVPANTKIMLTTEHLALEEGAVLEGEITYTLLSESSSSGFDAEKYYLPRGIKLVADDESLQLAGVDKKFTITGLFRRLNEKLTAKVMAHTKREYGGAAAAVLLGNDEYLSEKTSRDFRRLGISHLLVVSGTHFSVILAFAERAMIRMRINRRKRSVISIASILFYMGITGFSTSVLRAGIMYLIAQIAVIADRKVNYLHSLAFAGSAIILFNPYSALDCGLQLSFTAAYSCLMYNSMKTLFYKYRKEKRKAAGKPIKPYSKSIFTRLCRSIAEVTVLTTVVNINILPLIWLYFGEVSLISIPANIIFIPLITFLLYLTGAYLILYPFGMFIYLLGICINQCCALMLGLAEFISKLKNIMIPVNYQFTIFFLIPLTALILLIPFVFKRHSKKLIYAAVSVFVAFFVFIGIINMADRSNVYFSYVTKSKNDGFVLKSEGKTLLCDISDASFGFLYQLTNAASDLHSCETEALLLTHYHNKHVQYLERLCEREVLRNIILPEPINENEELIYEALLEMAARQGVEAYTIDAGGSFYFGDAEIILHERSYLTRSTHPITAVSVEVYNNTASILSCSFNQASEEITEFAEASDYVIFGHHSPVYKKAFGLSFDEAPKAVLVSDAAYEYMTDEFIEFLNSVNTVCEPLALTIKINQNGNCTTLQ